MSFDRLIEGIIRTQNPTVVGLDPKLEYIPEEIRRESFAACGENLEGAGAAIFAFNRGLIDALCDIVPAVKPQCAYYEMYGWPGMKALHDTIEYAQRKGMFVITDGKRNDIGTTMEAYAKAYLGKTEVQGNTFIPFGGDALTVNAYLGSDGIQPLLPWCESEDKGIFVLVKTSNRSSGELQNLNVNGGDTVYFTVAQHCETWGTSTVGKYGYSGVGAVVGATYPEQLRELRQDLPTTFFLVPGYGAQGGGPQDVEAAFDSRGLGAVINSSRGILCAWQQKGCAGSEYTAAAREAAIDMRDAIVGRIGKIG